VICSGEVRLRRVAPVQLRVSLQKVLQLSTGAVADFFSEKKSNTYRLGRISRGEQGGHVWHGVHVQQHPLNSLERDFVWHLLCAHARRVSGAGVLKTQAAALLDGLDAALVK
jgi:hypothetical protein